MHAARKWIPWLVLCAGSAQLACGPSDEFEFLGASRKADDTVSAFAMVKCSPGLGDCPKQVCFHATFTSSAGAVTADKCETLENVHSGHLYRPTIDAPSPIPREAGATVRVDLTSGFDGTKIVPIPVTPG